MAHATAQTGAEGRAQHAQQDPASLGPSCRIALDAKVSSDRRWTRLRVQADAATDDSVLGHGARVINWAAMERRSEAMRRQPHGLCARQHGTGPRWGLWPLCPASAQGRPMAGKPRQIQHGRSPETLPVTDHPLPPSLVVAPEAKRDAGGESRGRRGAYPLIARPHQCNREALSCTMLAGKTAPSTVFRRIQSQ